MTQRKGLLKRDWSMRRCNEIIAEEDEEDDENNVCGERTCIFRLLDSAEMLTGIWSSI